MLARLLSVCRGGGGGGRSSWRGGAGIIKRWRGASGTSLSAGWRFLAAHVDISGSSESTVWFIFNRNRGGRTWPEGTPTSGCLLGLLILSQATTLSGMSCWAESQSCKWKSHVEIAKGRQRGLTSHPSPSCLCSMYTIYEEPVLTVSSYTFFFNHLSRSSQNCTFF